MGDEGGKSTGTLSPAMLIVICLLAGGAVLVHLTRQPKFFVSAIIAIVTEGGLAAMIFLAAGGYGYKLVARLAPPKTPPGLLVLTDPIESPHRLERPSVVRRGLDVGVGVASGITGDQGVAPRAAVILSP